MLSFYKKTAIVGWGRTNYFGVRLPHVRRGRLSGGRYSGKKLPVYGKDPCVDSLTIIFLCSTE